MSVTVEQLSSQILQQAEQYTRYTVAIAGPPAVGKSTLTQQLAEALAVSTSVAVVAMDGFHFDNRILEARDSLQRKGAPDTFDVGGLYTLLERLRAQDEDVAVPVFDRSLDLSRGSADIVSADDHILLVEGNYLLLNEAPWNRLSSYFDLRVFLGASLETLQNRLVQRWLDHKHTAEEALQRAQSNDLPNARFVLEHTTQWDIAL